MKRDLRERVKNKRRQYWWDGDRYLARVKWLFGTYVVKQAKFVSFFRNLRKGATTIMLFAFPAVTAIAFLLALAIGYLFMHLVVVATVSIILFIWMVFIDLLHLPTIAAFRCVETIRRQVLSRNIYVCPYCHTDIWKTRHKVPGYLCEHGKRHFFVWPSSYGLLSHKGDCGCSFPTIQWARNGSPIAGAAKIFCPICLRKTHTREIGIEDFGRLPHLGLAVLATRSEDGSKFLKSVWTELNRKETNATGLRVEHVDRSSAPEFQNLVQVPISSPTELLLPRRRKIGTWVWRVSGARGKALLYLHQLGLSELEDERGNRVQLFETISGLAFVISSRSESDEAEAVIGAVKRILEGQFGSVDRLRVPVALIVQDCANKKDAEGAIEDHLKRMTKATFAPVRIFGGGESIEASKWLIAKCKKIRML